MPLAVDIKRESEEHLSGQNESDNFCRNVFFLASHFLEPEKFVLLLFVYTITIALSDKSIRITASFPIQVKKDFL